MRSPVRTVVLACSLMLHSWTLASAEEVVPEDAMRLISAHEEDAEAIRFEAERKIALERMQLVKDLKTLQDKYTRAAKLDEAVAIRDYIRAIAAETLPAKDAPVNVLQLQTQVGRGFYFRVTGNRNGSCYGTGVYTGDSMIATAAVHAGVLKHGETRVVKVRVLPARANYASSTKHGITSSTWSNYPVSFSVERVRVEEVFDDEKREVRLPPEEPAVPDEPSKDPGDDAAVGPKAPPADPVPAPDDPFGPAEPAKPVDPTPEVPAPRVPARDTPGSPVPPPVPSPDADE